VAFLHFLQDALKVGVHGLISSCSNCWDSATWTKV